MTDVVAERGAVVSLPLRGKRLLKRVGLLALVVGALASGVWYGVGWWTVGRFVESTDDAYVGGDVTAIAPHVAGFVKSVNVADNAHVSAGQLLVTLDDRDTRAALDRAEAILASRRAALDSLEARLVLQRSTIDAASAEFDAKVAQSSFAASDAKRYSSFTDPKAVTRQETEKAVSLGAAAKASVAGARASLVGAKKQIDVLQAQITDAHAQIGQAQADVRTAELNLGYTQIRSPVDGYVGNRSARIGAYVTVGQYLVTVIPSRGLWVDANFKEDQLARMRLGDPASVVADIAPDLKLDGRIASLAPGAGAVFSIIPPENATGNFTKIVQRVAVRIALDGDAGALGLLRPGLSTTVRVNTRRDPK